MSGLISTGDYSGIKQFFTIKSIKMESKKATLGGAIVASAILALGGMNVQAGSMFGHQSLGSGDAIRTRLLNQTATAKNIELACGEKKASDSTATKKMKDGKCGEGKCGADKKDSKTKTKKKGKEGKCGEGKCGGDKKNM